MSSLSDDTFLTSIRLQLDGSIEVDRVRMFLQGDEVVGKSEPVTQVLAPDADLTGLEPQVLLAAAAWWTPESVQQRTAELLAAMEQQAGELLARQRDLIADLEREKAHHETLRADIEASRQALDRDAQAVVAAHRELDAEHATLAQRQEEVTTARASLFEQHEAIRRQRPELDALLADKAAEIAAPPSPPAAPPAPQVQGGARG